jgi:hypothetical protein
MIKLVLKVQSDSARARSEACVVSLPGCPYLYVSIQTQNLPPRNDASRTYRVDEVIPLKVLVLDLGAGSRPQRAVRSLFNVPTDGCHSPGQHFPEKAWVCISPLLLHVGIDGTLAAHLMNKNDRRSS